jgi:hypothetical protein
MVCENIFMAPPGPNGWRWCYEILNLKGHQNRIYYWFTSYQDFVEWVNFAYWWRCIGKGLRSRLDYLPYSKHGLKY